MQIRHVLLSIMALMSTPNPGGCRQLQRLRPGDKPLEAASKDNAHPCAPCHPCLHPAPPAVSHSRTCADDPLANDIAEVWKADLSKALSNAREWTVKYASA
jgi:hypothetical protein